MNQTPPIYPKSVIAGEFKSRHFVRVRSKELRDAIFVRVRFKGVRWLVPAKCVGELW
jgi:hypothetical protein